MYVIVTRNPFNIFSLMTEVMHQTHVYCQAFVYPELLIACCALESIQTPFKRF